MEIVNMPPLASLEQYPEYPKIVKLTTEKRFAEIKTQLKDLGQVQNYTDCVTAVETAKAACEPIIKAAINSNSADPVITSYNNLSNLRHEKALLLAEKETKLKEIAQKEEEKKEAEDQKKPKNVIDAIQQEIESKKAELATIKTDLESKRTEISAASVQFEENKANSNIPEFQAYQTALEALHNNEQYKQIQALRKELVENPAFSDMIKQQLEASGKGDFADKYHATQADYAVKKPNYKTQSPVTGQIFEVVVNETDDEFTTRKDDIRSGKRPLDKDGNEVTDTVRTDKFDRAMEAHRDRVQNKNTDRVVRSYLRTIGRGK